MEGYASEIIGLEDGFFYPIHITALVTLATSLLFACVVVIMSFKCHGSTSFYLWPKADRFVVYLSVCEGIFGLSHFSDHLQMLITKDHIYPVQLCQFYAFIVLEVLSAKNYLLLFIAINAFVLVKFQIQINLGNKDWKLLCYMFGLPLITNIVCLALNLLGPVGAFCGVPDVIGGFAITVFPVYVILFGNCILYGLTWYHIRRTTIRLLHAVGPKAQSTRGRTRASKMMYMFVLVFCIQWWAYCVFSIWNMLTTNVPSALFLFLVFFTNIGGILGWIVYYITQKGRRKTHADQMAYVLEPHFNQICKTKHDNDTCKVPDEDKTRESSSQQTRNMTFFQVSMEVHTS